MGDEHKNTDKTKKKTQQENDLERKRKQEIRSQRG